MEDSLELENLWDSINLNGQWQPSSLVPIEDSLLGNQILDDITLSADEASPLAPLPILNSDDILNALMDPLEGDDINQLFSTSFGELPRQSTIEETMESMSLNHSQTDILSSAICVQMGSSPVEHKEIENSILVSQIVRDQKRIMKNASKSKRKSTSQHSSSKVGPVDVLSSYGACQPCTTVQIQDDFDYSQQLFQLDSMESKKIQIIAPPRPTFRPRTLNESKNVSHFLRCNPTSQFEYPTIHLYPEWARQSVKNIICVTLVAKDRLPHAYTIENKTAKAAFDDDALIFRQNEPHTLYFCLTPEDFAKGYKSFMIEYIKNKQDDVITKELIKTRQLEQSMLRFTRYFQGAKNDFLCDENSAEYSNIMTEVYGDIAVEHLSPRYGPVCGNEHVHVLLKGRLGKDDITILVSNEEIGWRNQVSFTKNGNLIYFLMPAFPFPQCAKALANIIVFYKGEELYQSVYEYKGSLDQELSALNLNDSNPSPPPPTFNAYDFIAESTVRPVFQSSNKSSKSKSPKRLNSRR